MIDNGDGEETHKPPTREIHWESVIVQGIIQLIIFGGLCVSYALINERWKGSVDADLRNLASTNVVQKETNVDMRLAIAKLSDSIAILSQNQQRVIALLEVHMNADAAKFQSLKGKP